MTLRADRLKSNYLGCWIFEISSLPDLVNFSILFFVFLSICPLEFDKFHLVFAFWVAWGLGTLRLSRVWIYIWVFWKLGSLMWVKILKIFMKKWFFPNRSRIIPGSFPELQDIKIHHRTPIQATLGLQKNFKNSTWNPSFWWVLGLIFLIFLMLTHVLPAAGLEKSKTAVGRALS